MAEDSLLNSLIEKEIPDGLQALVDSHRNLAELAAYCKENYRQNPNKQAALNETKQYASQSLASVAYQVHSLAVNMLQMMDQQMIQLNKMDSGISGISLVCRKMPPPKQKFNFFTKWFICFPKIESCNMKGTLN